MSGKHSAAETAYSRGWTAERGLAGHLIAATLGHDDDRTTMNAYAAPGAAASGTNRRGLVLLNGGLPNKEMSAK
jgi:hypothetical protein